MTIEDYWHYDTDIRSELVDGVLVEMGAESPINPQIAMFLAFAFGALGIPPHQLAIGHQLEVSSTQATARQPDLIVHSAASEAAILADGKLLRHHMPVPLLVVEVVSSSDIDQKSRDRDYIEKLAEYAARGIPEYWIVDPVAALVTIGWLESRLDPPSYQQTQFRNSQLLVSPSFPALQLTAERVLNAGR